jgi:hypothetical protein
MLCMKRRGGWFLGGEVMYPVGSSSSCRLDCRKYVLTLNIAQAVGVRHPVPPFRSMEACKSLHLNMVKHEVYYRQGHLGAQHMNDYVADGQPLAQQRTRPHICLFKAMPSAFTTRATSVHADTAPLFIPSQAETIATHDNEPAVSPCLPSLKARM